MCGRYYNRRQKQELAERMKAKTVFQDPYVPDYNIAPTTFQPVIRQERDSGEREMVLLRWGLIPFFAKSLADWKGVTTINARAETVATSPTYRAPFKTRRCIIPADGFYEWKAADTPKGKKTPFAFSLRSGEPFAFAGLWDAWKEPKPARESVHTPDRWLQTFTIITTEANELMSNVHTRMPVILLQSDWDRWLDRTPTDQLPIDLLRPYESDAMQAALCNPTVGNVKNNGPEMLVCPASTEPLNLLNSA